MKRITALALLLTLLLTAAPALTEGKLLIEQENMFYYKPYVFVLARFTNVGDAPMEILSSIEMTDNTGETSEVGEYNVLGSVLQPGESAYAYLYVFPYGDVQVKSFKSDVEGMEPTGEIITTRFDSQAELKLDWGDGWDTGDYIFVTFTNITDETIFAPSASGILLDAEGQILYITVPVQYDLGITPGSTVIFKCDIPPYVLRNVDMESLTVDSAVYTDVFAD